MNEETAMPEPIRSEIDVEVRYRPYQLDPTASPGASRPVKGIISMVSA